MPTRRRRGTTGGRGFQGKTEETMSLKAKIEAVIYASEEPVTLAQLAGLLGHEAQAELDHLDSAQQALALEEAADPDELNGEVLDTAGSEAEHAAALDRALHEAAAEEIDVAALALPQRD